METRLVHSMPPFLVLTTFAVFAVLLLGASAAMAARPVDPRALHGAAESCHLEQTRALLTAAARPIAPFAAAKAVITAIKKVDDPRCVEIVRLHLENGFDPNMTSGGETLLEMAQRLERAQVVDLLKKGGAIGCDEAPRRLKDPELRIRAFSLDALARCGAAGVPPVLALLADPAFERHREALDVLRRIGPPANAAIPKLLLLLEDRGLALHAAHAIGAIDPSKKAEVLSALTQCVNRPDECPVGHALVVLVNLEYGDAVPPEKLVRLTRENDPQIPGAAWQLLELYAATPAADDQSIRSLKKCRDPRLTRACPVEGTCQRIADFDGDGKPDVATRVTKGPTHGVAIVSSKGRCQVWKAAGAIEDWTIDSEGLLPSLVVRAANRTVSLSLKKNGALVAQLRREP